MGLPSVKARLKELSIVPGIPPLVNNPLFFLKHLPTIEDASSRRHVDVFLGVVSRHTWTALKLCEEISRKIWTAFSPQLWIPYLRLTPSLFGVFLSFIVHSLQTTWSQTAVILLIASKLQLVLHLSLRYALQPTCSVIGWSFSMINPWENGQTRREKKEPKITGKNILRKGTTASVLQFFFFFSLFFFFVFRRGEHSSVS